MKHTLKVDADINIPEAFSSAGQFSSQIPIPASTDLSIYHDFNPKWTVIGGIDYTQWSQLDKITMTYSGNIYNYVQTTNLPLNFRDTLRYALGINYHANNKWMLRTGVAFDESLVRNATERTFSFPDANRVWLVLGMQYKLNHNLTLDAGYAHLFVANADVNQTLTDNNLITDPYLGLVQFQEIYFVIGSVTGSVNEFGLQLTWNFSTQQSIDNTDATTSTGDKLE